MKVVEIWVQLLEEGSPAIRGANAQDLGNGQFKIIKPADYNSEDEIWEFPPGSVVRCKKHINFGREILLAIEKVG